jgi:hypothetical protein
LLDRDVESGPLVVQELSHALNFIRELKREDPFQESPNVAQILKFNVRFDYICDKPFNAA